MGLPEAKEFKDGGFADWLYLGRKGYGILIAEVLKISNRRAGIVKNQLYVVNWKDCIPSIPLIG